MYNDQANRGHVSEKAQFEYAWCLVRSRYIEDMKKGVALLEGTIYCLSFINYLVCVCKFSSMQENADK